MLIGKSAHHGAVPAALLGGRFYTGRQVYVYTDFGGGVDKDETTQQGAFREFAEELLGQNEEDAKATAHKLCSKAALVGGRSFEHKGYAMFIVFADTIVEALELPAVVEGMSAIDHLFALAVRNSELTSVALVGLEELLRGALTDGWVCPLSTRQLDGQDRSSTEIQLRQLMVGAGGSISTIRDVLETSMDQQMQLPCVVDLQSDQDAVADLLAETPIAECGEPRRRRWNRTSPSQNEPFPEEQQSAVHYYTAALPNSTTSPTKIAQQAQTSSKRQKPIPYVFDMETGDPDDVLTLLLLGSHPDIDLRAVTVTPGSQEQMALVRWLLQQMGLMHVRLGAQDWPNNSTKPIPLNARFYQSFGRMHAGEPRCERADQVLLECCDDTVTLVTGAALHNLGKALEYDGFRLGRWVAQGGFAGEGVVPRERQMDKFKGLETCSTWNFCGNIPAAQRALASSAITRKICVSKNVCHSVNYDEFFHAALGAAVEVEAKQSPKERRAVALGIMHHAMDDYLRHKPGGKKLHDPLALAVAIDESVCELVEVELYCQKGRWGSRLSPGSDILISVAYDAEKFVSALLH